MKNLHLIPTDKPSRLCINGKNGQHIYITSDEEIKEGDYGLDIFHKEVRKFRNKNFQTIYDKKIILTTDLDLQKDGVQSIPDEFLEWFVKNPSCENVGIEPDYDEVRGDYYKIVTPKEEPKQETLEEAAEIKFNVFQKENPIVPKNHIQPFKLGFINGAKWQAERMYSEEEVLEILEHHTSYLETFIYQYVDKNDIEVNEEWFKQFKKKQ